MHGKHAPNASTLCVQYLRFPLVRMNQVDNPQSRRVQSRCGRSKPPFASGASPRRVTATFAFRPAVLGGESARKFGSGNGYTARGARIWSFGIANNMRLVEGIDSIIVAGHRFFTSMLFYFGMRDPFRSLI
jgi:hypothetical protein